MPSASKGSKLWGKLVKEAVLDILADGETHTEKEISSSIPLMLALYELEYEGTIVSEEDFVSKKQVLKLHEIPFDTLVSALLAVPKKKKPPSREESGQGL